MSVKIISWYLSVCMALLSGAGCAPAPQDPIQIKITLEDGAEMKGELYPDVAPISVENFVSLVEEDFFDGLIFHRVIPGFMIQGGGYDQTFYEGNFNSKEIATITGFDEIANFSKHFKKVTGVNPSNYRKINNIAKSELF